MEVLTPLVHMNPVKIRKDTFRGYATLKQQVSGFNLKYINIFNGTVYDSVYACAL